MLSAWLLECVHFFRNLVNRARICLCFQIQIQFIELVARSWTSRS